MVQRRRTRVWVGGAVLAALGTIGLVLVVARVPLSSERLRQEVIATLSERLDAKVELRTLELHPFPRLRVIGEGLIIRHRQQPAVPLIAVDRFTVGGDLLGLLRRRVAQVNLEGLAIQVPPGRDDGADRGADDRSSRSGPPRELVIDRVTADGATLTLIPREAGKRPRVWQLHRLEVEQVGLGRAMPFHSVLTNAVPPGQIDTSGTFGPWQVDDPGATPVTGSFTFANADLSVFKGIGGILAARGTYDGSLGRIEAKGHTTTPDFVVNTSGQPVALETTYRAVIDGTNGDTTLERVEARFLETELVASGGVYDVPDQDGRRLALDVTMARGRLEDVLRLAVPSPTPTMTGALTLDARLDLPPGDREVIEKLRLDGSFTIDDGRFTDREVQHRVNTLSGKARDLDEDEVRGVRSDFTGRFQLLDSQLMLDPLRFNVPGALVELHGSYALRSERLTFAGQLLMDASVSDTVNGWKSLLLKPFDPLFRKDGQTFVPLRISGTRKSPSFGVDVKRIFDKDAPPTPPRRVSSSRQATVR